LPRGPDRKMKRQTLPSFSVSQSYYSPTIMGSSLLLILLFSGSQILASLISYRDMTRSTGKNPQINLSTLPVYLADLKAHASVPAICHLPSFVKKSQSFSCFIPTEFAQTVSVIVTCILISLVWISEPMVLPTSTNNLHSVFFLHRAINEQ
jgi:hypothetical protein